MKHLKTRDSTHPISWLIAATLSGAVCMSGCGGGGDSNGDAAPVLAPNPLATPSPAATAVRALTPAPDPYAAVAGSEPAVVVPEPGSTAGIGSGSEGVYEALGGYTFVTGAGDIARQLVSGSVWGSVDVTGRNWVFKPGTQLFFRTFVPVSGAGTFSPGVSMDGSYSKAGGTSEAWGPLKYSDMNAIAVTQKSVAGTWRRAESDGIGMSIDIDATGAFAGRTTGSQIGVCAVSGAVHLMQPETSKNLYSLTMTAVNAAAAGEVACAMSARLYAGPSAIVQESAGIFVSNGYFRALFFLMRTAAGSTLSLGMRKQ